MQIKFSKANVFTVKLLGESRGGGTHYPFKEASNTNFKKIYIEISKT